jgi:hypothetical protein
MAKHKSTEARQGTFEWFKSRWGKITGSERISTIMTANPHELNRLLEWVRWAKQQPDSVIEAQWRKEDADANQYMLWGRQHEEEAVRTYQMQNNSDVIWSPGFLDHPDWPELCGISRDFVDTTNNWLGEVKCPGKPENHAKTIKYGMGRWHVNQTQLGLECDRDRNFLIFCSYDPRHPVEKDRLYQQLIKRDDEWVEKFRRVMGEFATHFENGTDFRHATVQRAEGVPQLF